MMCGQPLSAQLGRRSIGQQQSLAAARYRTHIGSHSTVQDAAASSQRTALHSAAAAASARLQPHAMLSAARCCSPFTRQSSRRITSLKAATAATAAAAAAASASGGSRNKIVFLGTPDVAAGVLQQLLAAAEAPGADFEVRIGQEQYSQVHRTF